MSTAVGTEDPPGRTCGCCGGHGEHVYRPYLTASPDDDDEGCVTCGGTGVSHFTAQRDSCAGYRKLRRRN